MKLIFKSGKSINFNAVGWQIIKGALGFIGFIAVCGFMEAI